MNVIVAMEINYAIIVMAMDSGTDEDAMYAMETETFSAATEPVIKNYQDFKKYAVLQSGGHFTLAVFARRRA